MNRNINGYQVVWNKGYDRRSDEGIITATRARTDGSLEIIKSCVDDSITTFVTMLKSKSPAV